MNENDVTSAERWGRTMNVLEEVYQERQRQFELWGDQNFPFHQPGDHRGVVVVGRSYKVMADMIRARCDIYRARAEAGHPDLRNNGLVLLEEVFEALAEIDPAKIREELVQVAAVAVKAIETLDRRGDAGDDRLMQALIGRPMRRVPGTNTLTPIADPLHDHGDGPRPCRCGATGQAAKCKDPSSHNYGCHCPPPSEQEAREAECVINDPGAGDGEVSAAEQVLHAVASAAAESGGPDDWPTVTPEEIDANYRKDLVEDAPKSFKIDMVHEHAFDRLHGLCRCGEREAEGGT